MFFLTLGSWHPFSYSISSRILVIYHCPFGFKSSLSLLPVLHPRNIFLKNLGALSLNRDRASISQSLWENKEPKLISQLPKTESVNTLTNPSLPPLDVLRYFFTVHLCSSNLSVVLLFQRSAVQSLPPTALVWPHCNRSEYGRLCLFIWSTTIFTWH